MNIFAKLKRKLAGLDEKLGTKKLTSSKTCKWAITLGTGLVASVLAFDNIPRYNQDRNEYVYQEAEHISAPRYFNVSSASDANKLLLDFPREILGAERVDKYVTLDAKYCLVHVRQEHSSPIEEQRTQMHLEELKKVQNSIYDILSFLYSKYGKTGKLEVYNESEYNLKKPSLEETLAELKKIDFIYAEELNKFKKNYKKIVFSDSQIQEEFDSIFYDCEIGKLKKTFETYRKYDLEMEKSRKNSVHAIDRLVLEGKIKTKGFENLRVKNYADFLLDGRLFLSEALLDDREDSFLEECSQLESPLIFLVLGGYHAFAGTSSFGDTYRISNRKLYGRDNLAEWNEKHPDKKFSLIEITPIGFPKIE
jgi:hypothetical protein